MNDAATTPTPKPRRMLQPTKDALRDQLALAAAEIERVRRRNEKLHNTGWRRLLRLCIARLEKSLRPQRAPYGGELLRYSGALDELVRCNNALSDLKRAVWIVANDVVPDGIMLGKAEIDRYDPRRAALVVTTDVDGTTTYRAVTVEPK